MNLNIIYSFFFVLLFACQNTSRSTDEDNHTDHSTDNHLHEDETSSDHHSEKAMSSDHEVISLTRDQMNTISIEFGSFSEMKINDFIKATGTLGLPPNAYTSVNTKFPGVISNSIKMVEGEYIQKGKILAYIENPDLILKQESYLTLQAELIYLQQSIARQETLANAKAGIEKNRQSLESDIAIKKAQIQSIEKQLTYYGIDVGEIEKNPFVDKIPLISPSSGYITAVNIHNGQYVNPQDQLLEIISNEHLHLELDVFEKDIALIEKGQKITYTIPALGSKMYNGEVEIIGKEFNLENKTVRIHGHLDEEIQPFIKDLFIDAKIWLNGGSVTALPEEAIIQDGESSYIYTANPDSEGKSVEFKKIMVIPESTSGGYTSLRMLEDLPSGHKIVIKGSYYIYAHSKSGELEHEH
ncbi:efflux RND transporter periplasmic adaptor subunit [Membranihabitans marinus]|uniref:efflux RND transporter periplasmic adaptor subunit n=1 Tax=Membranihabitans marinus TaxID=1227546 RepID=UPI001F1A333B|nr:efflux RND transporter periplasmic adaptor subunit [Membranihabitans marinus]